MSEELPEPLVSPEIQEYSEVIKATTENDIKSFQSSYHFVLKKDTLGWSPDHSDSVQELDELLQEGIQLLVKIRAEQHILESLGSGYSESDL